MPSEEECRTALQQTGFLILPDFIPEDWLTELQSATERLFQMEGERAGAEFRQEAGSRRLANLVNKGEVFRRMIVEPRLLDLIRLVLPGGFKLSSLNARSASPQNETAQPLHADMGAVPDEHGFWVCNSVWMLDDFTEENGPLRVVPGSHHWGRTPQEALDDPAAPHPDEVILTGKAGTVIVMNAHCWHGGQANRTSRPRTALHAFFSRRDKPQQQYQKRLIDPELQAGFPPLMREVLALDDALNDRVTANAEKMTGFLKS